MIPVKTWRIKRVSAALPKTYHQLADLRGTGWVIASRTPPPICNLRSNQSAMFFSLDIRSSSLPDSPLWTTSAVVRLQSATCRPPLCTHTQTVRAEAVRRRVNRPGNTHHHDRDT